MKIKFEKSEAHPIPIGNFEYLYYSKWKSLFTYTCYYTLEGKEDDNTIRLDREFSRHIRAVSWALINNIREKIR